MRYCGHVSTNSNGCVHILDLRYSHGYGSRMRNKPGTTKSLITIVNRCRPELNEHR